MPELHDDELRWEDTALARATALIPRFVARLRRVPLRVWVSAAHLTWQVKENRSFDSAEYRLARRRLRAALDRTPGVVRYTRRQIHELAETAAGFLPGISPRVLTRVALLGAFALVARPLLSDADFARLYEPLRGLIPPEDLLQLL